MMFFLSLATFFLPAVLGAPSTVDKREPGIVKLCTGVDFAEPCVDLWVGIGGSWEDNCQKLEDPYAMNAGSVVPDKGALCRLYDGEHSTCLGTGLVILEYPGEENLFNISNVGHQTEYISCVTCSNCQGD